MHASISRPAGWLACVVVSALVAHALPAQAAVRFLPDKRLWVLDAGSSSYVLGVNDRQQVQLFHWGGRLDRDEDLPAAQAWAEYPFEASAGMTPEEYPGFGGMRYDEPCLKITFDDGVRDLVLVYDSHQIQGESLEIRLRDIRRQIFVTLRYRVFPREGILRKQALIENRETKPVMIESAQSAVWQLPRGSGYRLSYLTGRWGGETQLTRAEIDPGKQVLESRRGNTSHQMNPWFAIDSSERAGETHGRVWFGALGWSGNWKIVVEQTPNQQVRVTGGCNDFDFGYLLKPGEQLETPPFYGGFTSQGFGEASRMLHRLERQELLPDRAAPHPRPVLYNSWEATEFNIDEAGQVQLAEKAARLGAELFVVDDGWFGKRNDDHAGLGDWYVNRTKFPNGLKPLIDRVSQLGMKFGLWVEPEMVNPDSDLYRQHPDWVINFPGRPRSEGRNQLVLNMARDDVKEYIFHALDRLLAENNIAFIKWDMNRHVTEPGWPELPPQQQKRIWIDYVRSVYGIIDRLRAAHPQLEIESCSGGGGRVDLGILSRVDQAWTSDNTDALDRLRIQEGFSFAYAPKVMEDWVTDVPSSMDGRITPLKFRFLAAMMGSLGIGGNLNKWSEAEMEGAARLVAYFKQIRETVQHGDLYRLLSPREGAVTANFYVSEDGRQAVLFAFLDHEQFRRPAPVLYPRGLREDAVYQVHAIDDKLLDKQEALSGAYLMQHGIALRLSGDYDSTSVWFERKDAP